jgi:hypothetical protein
MTVKDGSLYRFALSSDGRDWKEIEEDINGSFMEAVRVALTAGGSPGATARFEWLRIEPTR